MLEHIFSRDVVHELERLVDDRVERRLAEHERERTRDDWLPLAEAAQLLGCTPAALRERERRGVLQASRMSRRLYFKKADIYAELERRKK